MVGNQKSYTTKEIADLANVHPNTVRLYEKWGFIAPAKRKNNNYRVFNEKHLYQMKLARVALPGPYPIKGELVKQIVIEFAKDNKDLSLYLANEYLQGVVLEKNRANQAIIILDNWFERKTGDKTKVVVKGRKLAAKEIGVTIDSLRTWERNGLFVIEKDNQGLLLFTEWDIEKIKVIRLLRNCGCSIAALTKVFSNEENFKEKPSVLLKLPDYTQDFFYVTDMFLDFLDEHQQRAERIIDMIRNYHK
ncbi:hypothetical protein SYNTR_2071 [Candidatus Syntrophocurvum alkaliphilum]|uniref:HTH merR-type domain-containing protein n=1 Tax=Candidatus Syntrophocurvum alkaliphilum TaxID=2293317 RepID=A0A6I6DDL7_9FIRM|nr:MerR family transcriptional regulator [Candidatus Syntrophocurvum alkaliphilum]QGU00665.1 hypothetical protein SYNTR_2071 [Candidatus Syntrophocurvum alkaliphilum]